jgi:uncharacterized RDD family membrane protein YckC
VNLITRKNIELAYLSLSQPIYRFLFLAFLPKSFSSQLLIMAATRILLRFSFNKKNVTTMKRVGSVYSFKSCSNVPFHSFSTLANNLYQRTHHHRDHQDNYERIEEESNSDVNLLGVSSLGLISYLFTDKKPSSSADEIANNISASAQMSLVPAAPLSLSPLAGEDEEICPVYKRILAFLIDNILVSLLFQLNSTLLQGSFEYLILPISLAYNAAYEILCIWRNGQTIGKYLLDIRTTSNDHTPISFSQSVQLFVYKLLLNLTLGADFLWMLFDFTGDKQALHNYLTNTVVVQTKRIEKNENNKTVE